MLLRLFILLLIVCGMAVEKATAQINLQGQLADNKRNPLPGANIKLVAKNEPKPLSTTSDSAGIFRFSALLPGPYQLTISRTGITETSLQLNLVRDSFIMVTAGIRVDTLAAVTITGQKPTFERKSDRFVFNLANSALLPGNTVWDILKQTPMINATETGGLNILGNAQQTAVFINRRRFALSGDDLYRYLKDMPADNIIRIEILPIPPPSYDVAGPVIDIQLKKLDINGTRGSISAAYERASVGRGTANLTLDVNRNNYNQSFFLNTSGGNGYQRLDKTSAFKNTVQGTNIDSDIALDATRKRINGYTDLRYSISPLITAGTQWTFNSSVSDNNGKGSETIYPSGNISRFDQTMHTDRVLFAGNLFLKYYSARRRKMAELSGDYLHTRMNQRVIFLNSPNTGSIQTRVPQEITNHALKFDYSAPAGKAVFEAGGRWSRSLVETPYNVFSLQGADWVQLNNLSAAFSYREYIYSAYGTLEKNFSDKWSAKAGVRAELTDINTVTTGEGKPVTNKNSYVFFFPIGYLNFNPSENHGFSLASRTSNTRPDYFSLNPARIMLGVRTITEGNPYLNPSGGGVVEFTYTYKQRYIFGLNYTVNNRLFSQQNEVIPPDTLLIKWMNWGNLYQYNAWFYANQDVVKSKWSVAINVFSGLNRRQLSDPSLVNNGYINNFEYSLYLGNSFTNILSKNFRFYCNLSFNSPQRFGLWRELAGFRVDAGGSWNFPKKGWRVSLALNDLFKYHDRNVYTINETSAQLTRVLTNNDLRSARITLAKTFGNQKARKLTKRETANEEEKGRLN